MTKTVIKAIRVAPELWAEVERYAKAAGVSVNAYVVGKLEAAMAAASQRRAVIQKPPKPVIQSGSVIQVGPVAAAPGSRLKKR